MWNQSHQFVCWEPQEGGIPVKQSESYLALRLTLEGFDLVTLEKRVLDMMNYYPLAT